MIDNAVDRVASYCAGQARCQEGDLRVGGAGARFYLPWVAAIAVPFLLVCKQLRQEEGSEVCTPRTFLVLTCPGACAYLGVHGNRL